MSEHERNKELIDVMDDHFNYNINSKHFSDFGAIIEYDNTQCRASIQPSPNVAIKNEEDQIVNHTQPIIHNVPILWLGYGNFNIQCSLKKGDKVLIIWLKNEHQDYKGTAYNVEPYQLFGYSNAVAIPIETISNISLKKGLSLTNKEGNVYININEDKSIKVTNSNGEILLNSNGEINLKTQGGISYLKNDKSILFQNGSKATSDGDFVTKSGISLQNHTHGDPQGGKVSPPS